MRLKEFAPGKPAIGVLVELVVSAVSLLVFWSVRAFGDPCVSRIADVRLKEFAPDKPAIGVLVALVVSAVSLLVFWSVRARTSAIKRPALLESTNTHQVGNLTRRNHRCQEDIR